MNLSRITDPNRLKPSHVVLVVLAAVVLAGSCLLTDGPYREVLHDGQIEWGADSPMRAIVSVLNLQFSQTTSKGVAIKSLVFGVGAGLAMIIFGFALGIRPPVGEEETLADRSDDSIAPAPRLAGAEPTGESDSVDDDPPAKRKVHIPPFAAAQFMMMLFGLWALCSGLWSQAPEYALGGAALLGIQLLWAFALGLGLNRRAAGIVAVILIAVTTITAGLAIAYMYARNPELRVSYPIGNPLFLAACLIPGILIAVGVAMAALASFRKSAGRSAVALLGAILALGILLWAMYLTRSRGPAVALAAGFGGLVFFSLHGARRWMAALVIVLVLASGMATFFAQREADSPTGRSATIRVRMFSWGYAFDLAVQAPLMGTGQGGFVLKGDAMASGLDALDDPQALNARLAHAHNEWLEIWSELGSIGLVLIAAALTLTFRAGMLALDRMESPWQRWMMIALLASLAALIVDECLNVALRLPGLPTVYYTVIGLIWAMCTVSGPRWRIRLQTAPGLIRWGSAAVACVLGMAAAILSVGEFQSARMQYDVGPLLTSRQWDQAYETADRARLLALNPQDRLIATATFCSTNLYIAEEFQSEWFRQMSAAYQADPPDQRLMSLAAGNREISETFAARGMGVLKELLTTVPSCWNSGVWESGLFLVLAKYAEADNQIEAATAHVGAAVDGLERELQRRPFEPMLAAQYASLAANLPSESAPLGKLVEVLARPLRIEPTPPQYIPLVTQLQQRRGFDDEFNPILDVVNSVKPEQPVAEWEDPWAPEKLRLAAVILFTRDRHAEAAELLKVASALYVPLGGRARVGSAACMAELADARFYSNPDDVQPAVEMAEKAIERVPNSEIGRFMSAAIRNRMATYLLAAGRLDEARSLFRVLASEAQPEQIEQEIGRRFSDLAHSHLWTTNERLPQAFPRWVEFAIEFNPEFEATLPDTESARVLDLALRRGADLRVISAFIDRVLAEHPESEPYLSLRSRINDALGIPTTQPAATTQPANGDDPTGPTSAPAP